MTEKTTRHATVCIAPLVRDAAHAKRIEETMEALEASHRAVADAAGRWVDEGCPSLRSDEPGAAIDLRDSVATWREKGDAFARAVAGRP